MKMRREGQFQKFSEASKNKNPQPNKTCSNIKNVLRINYQNDAKKREQTIHVHEWINDEYRNTVTSLS